MIDPGLFRSRAYTWGVILIALEVTAMTGVLFTLPQYFQGVGGADPMGSGLRLAPLVAGLTLGAIPADRITARLGAKLTAALGLGALAAGLACGSATTTTSSVSFVSLWTAVVGAGMGLSLATASSAALAELTPGHSGIGSAVLQALNKTGGPLGAAVLGSVLSATYVAHLHLSSWPDAVRQTARQSIFGALSVAQRAHSPWLVHYARTAFTHGLDASLLVAAAIAGVGALLALLFLPAITSHPEPPGPFLTNDDRVLSARATAHRTA